MPSHRPIVPSDTMRTEVVGDSSSATPASGSGNTESATGPSSGRWDSGDSGASHEALKKRRTPGAVAAIACIDCRKARQKVCVFFSMLNDTVINLQIPGRVCPRLTYVVPSFSSAMAQDPIPAQDAKPVASNVAMSLIPKPAKNCFCRKSPI
ncbi:MAG: hypothetical protein L6R42_007225 [Xanthoria sp. 1 TBL-2021]|nr:MAG: hypothetical protein L6R42_007225 [Xanthoria sp. 1 TBL-2021]